MTQLEDVVRLVGKLDTDKTRDLQTKLGDVRQEAQVRTDDGGRADGSITEKVYNRVLTVEQVLGDLARAIDALHVEVGRAMVK